MKWKIILTHPVLVVSLFCLTLISGKHIGGVYLLYILTALPHGGIHALFAVAGISIILFSYGKFKGASQFMIDPILNLFGVGFLYFSLWIFFYRTWDYNGGTFDDVVPIITHVLFVLVSLGFLLRSIITFVNHKHHGHRLLT